MPDPAKPLEGHRVLILEERYLIADNIKTWVQSAGAAVEGPYGHILQAKAALRSQGFDLAVLDIGLCGTSSFPLVEELDRQGVGYVFATAHGPASIPPRWWHVPRCGRSCTAQELIAALASVVRVTAAPP